MSDEQQGSIIIVREGEGGAWHPLNRFATTADAQKWLKQGAPAGVYHLLAFRYEDIEVKEAPPQPPRNEVVMGKQHLTRMRADDATSINEGGED